MRKPSGKPVEVLAHETLRAALWKNEGPNGSYYSVTFSRAYARRGGEVRNTASFKQQHLADLAKIAARAAERLTALDRAAQAKLAN